MSRTGHGHRDTKRHGDGRFGSGGFGLVCSAGPRVGVIAGRLPAGWRRVGVLRGAAFLACVVVVGALLGMAPAALGASWAVQSTPNPVGGATSSSLFGVSCSSASACMA